MAIDYPILYLGTTYTLSWVLQDDAGDPINLTGWEVFSSGKMDPTDPQSPSFDFTYTVVSASAGTFTLSLTAAQTALIPEGEYQTDVLLKNGSTVYPPVAEGTITARRTVTEVS